MKKYKKFLISCCLGVWVVHFAFAAGLFEAVRPGYVWRFPRDHGAHGAYRVERWHTTANLKTDDGRHFGVQLTFLRLALKPQRETNSSFEPVNLYFAHFGVSDAEKKTFERTEKANRSGSGVAGSREGRLWVWNEDMSASYEPPGLRLLSSGKRFGLDLKLSSAQPPVRRGREGWFERGPNAPEQFYSLPGLKARGVLTVEGVPLKVSGDAWMDHEFFTERVPESVSGWDAMGLHLSDGSQLMWIRSRNSGGASDAYFEGIFVEREGKIQRFTAGEFRVEPVQTWKSPRTGAEYPVQWKMTFPARDMEFVVGAPFGDHEWVAKDSTDTVYWEGPVAGKGMKKGQPVVLRGFLEMTGYDGKPVGF